MGEADAIKRAQSVADRLQARIDAQRGSINRLMEERNALRGAMQQAIDHPESWYAILKEALGE